MTEAVKTRKDLKHEIIEVAQKLGLHLCDKCVKGNAESINGLIGKLNPDSESGVDKMETLALEIKEIIKTRTVNDSLLTDYKRQMVEIKQEMTSLNKRLMEIDARQQDDLKQVGRKWSDLFAAKVDTLTKEVKTEVKTVQKSIEDRFHNEKEVMKRENNIIIYRMKESVRTGKEGYDDDRVNVKKIIDTLGDNGVGMEAVENMFRLGRKEDKVRPILIQFKERTTKNLLMENLKRLSSLDDDLKNVGINHDFSREQREECRKLVIQAKKKKLGIRGNSFSG